MFIQRPLNSMVRALGRPDAFEVASVMALGSRIRLLTASVNHQSIWTNGSEATSKSAYAKICGKVRLRQPEQDKMRRNKPDFNGNGILPFCRIFG